MKRLRHALVTGLALCVAGEVAAAAAPVAELVSTKTSDGVLLHGLHYRPAGPSHRVVIHLPGGPGAFYSPQDLAPLAARLVAQGTNFLSVNLRTAGTNGMYYAKFEEYPLDIAAWVRYATSQGLGDVILLGHSLSSARAIHYLATTRDPAVKGLVVSAGITSPYLESQMRWNEAERARYDAFLAGRREDVRAGRGRTLHAYPWGPGREFEFSAATWVNVFGRPDESDASTVKFAADVRVPVLVIHGTADQTALPKNAEEILAALVNSPAKELAWVEGGNHLFIGTAEPWATRVADWVARPVAAPKAASRGE